MRSDGTRRPSSRARFPRVHSRDALPSDAEGLAAAARALLSDVEGFAAAARALGVGVNEHKLRLEAVVHEIHLN